MLSEEKSIIDGELTENGFLFYVGTVEMKQEVFIESFCEKTGVYLQVTDFHGCVAEIIVNGISCGDIYRAPYKADITKAICPGTNEIKILLTNTLRPILGPYHRTHGEIGECWGGGYGDPDSAWTGSCAGADWYKNTLCDNDIWTDSYNQVRFGILDAKIVLEKNK